jgi:hypothetical protein
MTENTQGGDLFYSLSSEVLTETLMAFWNRFSDLEVDTVDFGLRRQGDHLVLFHESFEVSLCVKLPRLWFAAEPNAVLKCLLRCHLFDLRVKQGGKPVWQASNVEFQARLTIPIIETVWSPDSGTHTLPASTLDVKPPPAVKEELAELLFPEGAVDSLVLRLPDNLDEAIDAVEVEWLNSNGGGPYGSSIATAAQSVGFQGPLFQELAVATPLDGSGEIVTSMIGTINGYIDIIIEHITAAINGVVSDEGWGKSAQMTSVQLQDEKPEERTRRLIEVIVGAGYGVAVLLARNSVLFQEASCNELKKAFESFLDNSGVPLDICGDLCGKLKPSAYVELLKAYVNAGVLPLSPPVPIRVVPLPSSEEKAAPTQWLEAQPEWVRTLFKWMRNMSWQGVWSAVEPCTFKGLSGPLAQVAEYVGMAPILLICPARREWRIHSKSPSGGETDVRISTIQVAYLSCYSAVHEGWLGLDEYFDSFWKDLLSTGKSLNALFDDAPECAHVVAAVDSGIVDVLLFCILTDFVNTFILNEKCVEAEWDFGEGPVEACLLADADDGAVGACVYTPKDTFPPVATMQPWLFSNVTVNNGRVRNYVLKDDEVVPLKSQGGWVEGHLNLDELHLQVGSGASNPGGGQSSWGELMPADRCLYTMPGLEAMEYALAMNDWNSWQTSVAGKVKLEGELDEILKYVVVPTLELISLAAPPVVPIVVGVLGAAVLLAPWDRIALAFSGIDGLVDNLMSIQLKLVRGEDGGYRVRLRGTTETPWAEVERTILESATDMGMLDEIKEVVYDPNPCFKQIHVKTGGLSLDRARSLVSALSWAKKLFAAGYEWNLVPGGLPDFVGILGPRFPCFGDRTLQVYGRLAVDKLVADLASQAEKIGGDGMIVWPTMWPEPSETLVLPFNASYHVTLDPSGSKVGGAYPSASTNCILNLNPEEAGAGLFSTEGQVEFYEVSMLENSTMGASLIRELESLISGGDEPREVVKVPGIPQSKFLVLPTWSDTDSFVVGERSWVVRTPKGTCLLRFSMDGQKMDLVNDGQEEKVFYNPDKVKLHLSWVEKSVKPCLFAWPVPLTLMVETSFHEKKEEKGEPQVEAAPFAGQITPLAVGDYCLSPPCAPGMFLDKTVEGHTEAVIEAFTPLKWGVPAPRYVWEVLVGATWKGLEVKPGVEPFEVTLPDENSLTVVALAEESVKFDGLSYHSWVKNSILHLASAVAQDYVLHLRCRCVSELPIHDMLSAEVQVAVFFKGHITEAGIPTSMKYKKFPEPIVDLQNKDVLLDELPPDWSSDSGWKGERAWEKRAMKNVPSDDSVPPGECCWPFDEPPPER